MTTIGDLADLLKMALTHTGNPALERLPEGERTVEGIARAHLPVRLEAVQGRSADWIGTYYALINHRTKSRPLHLTDPGTAHALLVALALALGLDAGEGALGVSWFPLPATDAAPWERWCLMANELYDFASIDNGYVGSTFAPTVAAEPHPVRALEQAVAHVLGPTAISIRKPR